MSGPRITAAHGSLHNTSIEETKQQGHFNGLELRVGESEPRSLSSVRGEKPSLGFRGLFQSKQTRVGRLAKHLDANAGKLLSTFSVTPGSKLQAGSVLSGLKTLRNHTAEMSRLGGKTVNHADALQMALATRFTGMDNQELMTGIQSFFSSEMAILRNGLQHMADHPEMYGEDAAEATKMLEDLNVCEAAYMMESALRIARGRDQTNHGCLLDHLLVQQPTDSLEALCAAYKTPLTSVQQQSAVRDTQLSVLRQSSGVSMLEREGMHEAGQQILDRKALGGELSLRQVGDVLRKADMTININLVSILRVLKGGGSLKNMFELGADRSAVYTQQRMMTEGLAFSPLAASDPKTSPADRPLYAALNVARFDGGAAPRGEYGETVIILKPEVKQRCTFSRDDSFRVQSLKVTPENLGTFATELDTYIASLPDEEKKVFAQQVEYTLASGETKTMSRKDAFLAFVAEKADTITGSQGEVGKWLVGALSEAASGEKLLPLPDDSLASLSFFFMQHFMDRASLQKNYVTVNDMESLLPSFMQDPNIRLDGVLANIISEKGGYYTAGYIEAQVHGSVALSEDVERISLSDEEIKALAGNAEHMELLRELCRERGLLTSDIATPQAAANMLVALLRHEKIAISLHSYTEQSTLPEDFAAKHRDVFLGVKKATNPAAMREAFNEICHTYGLRDVQVDFGNLFGENFVQEILKSNSRESLSPARINELVSAKLQSTAEAALREHNLQLVMGLDFPALPPGYAGSSRAQQTVTSAVRERVNAATTALSEEDVAQMALAAQREYIESKKTLIAELERLLPEGTSPAVKNVCIATICDSAVMRTPAEVQAIWTASLPASVALRNVAQGTAGYSPDALAEALLPLAETTQQGAASIRLALGKGDWGGVDDLLPLLSRSMRIGVARTDPPLNAGDIIPFMKHLTTGGSQAVYAALDRLTEGHPAREHVVELSQSTLKMLCMTLGFYVEPGAEGEFEDLLATLTG